MSGAERGRILSEALDLLRPGESLHNYECDCGWDSLPADAPPELRERFIVKRPGELDACFNIVELRARGNSSS